MYYKFNWVCVVLVISLAGASTLSFAQLSEPGVPTPTTYQWQNEHDLMLIFNDAQNDEAARAVASSIYDQCLTDTNLSTQQKYDGFYMSGQVFYLYGKFESAKNCFQGIVDLQLLANNHQLSEAHRMLGQINMLTGSFSSAADHYITAHDIYMTLDPESAPMGLNYNLPFVVHCLKQSKRYNEALQYADEAISVMDIEQYPKLPEIYEMAGDVAHEMENETLALSYYRSIGVDFPDYEQNDLLMSFPIRIQKKIAAAQGIDLYGCDADAVEKTMDIIINPDYIGMLERYMLAISLSECLQTQYDEKWSSYQLVNKMINELDVAIINVPAGESAFYMQNLKEIQVKYLYTSAKKAISLKVDAAEAQARIDRIATEFGDVDSIYVARAAQLQVSPQPAAP